MVRKALGLMETGPRQATQGELQGELDRTNSELDRLPLPRLSPSRTVRPREASVQPACGPSSAASSAASLPGTSGPWR